jgi:hypothetical protein
MKSGGLFPLRESPALPRRASVTFGLAHSQPQFKALGKNWNRFDTCRNKEMHAWLAVLPNKQRVAGGRSCYRLESSCHSSTMHKPAGHYETRRGAAIASEAAP